SLLVGTTTVWHSPRSRAGAGLSVVRGNLRVLLAVGTRHAATIGRRAFNTILATRLRAGYYIPAEGQPHSLERLMTTSLAALLRAARVYDLEQPRFRGMPIHPTHR